MTETGNGNVKKKDLSYISIRFEQIRFTDRFCSRILLETFTYICIINEFINITDYTYIHIL